MGNAFTEFMASADEQARGLLGTAAQLRRGNIPYAEVNLICAPAMEMLVFMRGGAEYQVKLTATLRRDDLRGMAPRQGDLVSVGGELYHVVAVSTTAADPLYTLQLGKRVHEVGRQVPYS